MSKTVAYIRVSTSKQLDGNGPEQQRANILGYAISRGVKIDEFVIEDESGTIYEREQIQHLLVRSQAKEVKTIILDRPDRLGRTLEVSERLFKAFEAAGASLCFASVEFDSSPSGNLFRQILAAIAEFDRTSWLSRMQSCKRAAVATRGSYAGGNVPYGYVSGGRGVLRIDPAAAAVVKRIFALEAQGVSKTAIAGRLAAEGYKTRKGTDFCPQQVIRILGRRDFYTARTVVHAAAAKLVDGVRPQHPPILEA